METLGEAIRKYWDSIAHDEDKSYMTSFRCGANWQKEQYKYLIQSHAELLDIAKSVSFMFGNEQHYPEGTWGYNLSNKAKSAIEKANQLLN